ncbi:hypothetical protein BLNAU_15598 [Blattamonas nauphoetae]|uniref:HAT C-terminal dimerisation domain-containing protein n=1 Tax=Blattamonas nauphoetae TaxID=2049346 RepID=A0ABQ9XH45_9EUKA|nr:hypothetical protein BLNAU_15598 [Blattamonas nauphoetae]
MLNISSLTGNPAESLDTILGRDDSMTFESAQTPQLTQRDRILRHIVFQKHKPLQPVDHPTQMGVKIIDLEYATLKSPDGHDRDFVYYHVCGADGKAKKNTKKTGVLCTYAKQIPICEAAKHVCSNTDSNLGTLDSFLQAQKELQEQPRNRRFPGLEDVVVDSRLDLLAGTRQPFTLADSPLLRRHEEILISVGQKNPNADVSKLVHSFTRQRASTLMKEKAELLEDVVLQKKIDDVVGLCMDSGTVGGITYNAFQFVNPQTYPSPVIADLRDEDHASVTLARSVATIIDKATENGLTIASVVSDSAACMIHCIDLDNIESDSHYTRFVSQPLSWRPFHSQCAAHLLHNAYRDAVGLSPLLRSIHTFVENLVNECRAVRYKSNFSRKPPRFLAHRWISISSLVLWVYQESKKLTELFPDQFTAQRQFEVLILYHLVIPLFQTVSYLESDQRSLSDVLPAVFQLLLHYEALTVLLQEHHQVWIPPTRTCEDCVFCRIVQTDSAMLRALAFSFTPFGRHVMTGIPFDRMKEVASYPASSPIEFIPLPTPSQLSLDERDLPDLTNPPTPIQIRTEGRRQAAIHQETHLQQTLIDLGPDIGEYFETGESEDGDSGVEEDYTPAQREMRQKSTLSQAGNKTIKEATIQVLRYELEYTQRFDDTSQDIPIQKVKRRCSSADYSQSDIIGKQSQLERLLEETIGEEHDSDDSADSDEYQTCRTVIGETQWKHLLCVQLGLTIRQSIPGLDPKSILCVQANYLAWLNHQLTLPFDCLFETKPYMYWKNNRDSSNIIVQTLSTVAVCMLSTAATEACCERLFSQMRTLIGSHRFSMDPETVRAILRVGSQACSKLLSIPN